MPSARAASCESPPAATAAPSPVAAVHLAAASRALWAATLSLMTAFMQMTAPAHRLLLARRIARNFALLADQECFDNACRASFQRLARRWQQRAAQLSGD